MNCPRCQTTNPPEARFCLNCGLALTRKCANCQSDLIPGARFCMNCGHPVITSSPADVNRLERLTAAVPASLAKKVREAAHLSSERRVVTVLFVDVVASTALSEQVDVETWTQIMNDAVDRVIPAIYRYEGIVARVLGDSILAFFGAPLAHEDDPARAVHAALDVLALGRDYAGELKARYEIDFAIRTCINTGTVVINAVGEDLRYKFTAMGGAVNLTSRIKFAAQPMTALVSQYTYPFIEPLFDLTPLEPVEVKGREDPVRVYRVEGVKAQPGRTRGIVGLHSPMVGRQGEIEILMSLCETVRAGLGRAVLLTGEPGIGKSRLIAEWRAVVEANNEEPPSLWVEARCLSYGQGLAYHLLTDLVRSILGAPTAAEEPELGGKLRGFCEAHFGANNLDVFPFLGQLLGIELEGPAQTHLQMFDPQALQNQYLAAMQQTLLALSSRQPLVIVLDDLHWADPSSVELFSRLMPIAGAARLLFCLLIREERDTPGWQLVTRVRELMGSSLAEIPLKALSEAESRQLVTNLLEIESLPKPARNLILKKAEGNPLFVEEVIRMLIDRGAILHQNGGWMAGEAIRETDIPDNLQGLLLARIDRLPEEIKQVLRVAAVIGRQFPVRVLEQVISNHLDE